MQLLSRILKVIKSNPLLTLALVGGFAFRILSTNPGYLSNGDELMYGEALNMFLNKTLSLHPQWMGYPPLVAWIMLVFFVFIFLPGAWIFYFANHFQDVVSLLAGVYQTSGWLVFDLKSIFTFQILGRNYVNVLYWGRYVTAIFGTASIYLVYLAVLNFFNKRVAIISALLVAVNYRLVLSSHIGFIDIYNVFFLFLSFWSVSSLLKRPDLKNYIFVWITIALSFLTKYQPYAFFPFILAHLYLSFKGSRNYKEFIRIFFSRKVIIGGLGALLIVIVAHAYHFLNLERVIAINRNEGLKYGFGTNSLNLFPISYLYHTAGVGPFLSIIALIGILFGIIKRRFRLSSILILSPLPLIAYLYFYFSGGGLYTRNLIVLIPIFLAFSAVTISEILRFALNKKSLFLKYLVYLLFVIVIFFSFKDHITNSFIMTKFYSGKSQEALAGEWIANNVKSGSLLATDNAKLIPPDKSVKTVKLPHPNTSFSYRELLQDNLDFVVVNVSLMNNYYFTWWMKQPLAIALKFWERPDNLIAQGYKMLALRELMWEHGQAAFLTTWQAPGFNYAIFKIDKTGLCGDMVLSEIENLNSLNWTPLYFLPEYKNSLYRNQDSNLVIKGDRAISGAVRWQSSSFNVDPGRCYEIEGAISSKDSVLKTERNGFLRIDFYRDSSDLSLTSRPIVSLVSERIYGEIGSHFANIQIIAPSGAKYAVVGFQADNSATDYTLSDLKVLESNNKSDRKEPNHLQLKDENILLYNIEGII